jgi:hypothetical protein
MEPKRCAMPRLFRTQLIDPHPVFLTHTRERRGRPEFVRIFPEAWVLLPEDAKAEVLRYWKEGLTSEFNPYWPRIVLVPNLDGNQSILGRCESHGYELSFVGPVMKNMPDQAAYGLVLHELTHVYCYATDHPSIFDYEPHVSENAVRKLIRGWKLMKFHDEVEKWVWYNL